MFRQSSIAALVAHRRIRQFHPPDGGGQGLARIRLLRDYREYGLPEPPKDAPLVRIDSGGVSVDADGKQTPILHLGFLLQPGDEKHPAVVLLGTVNYETQPKEGAIVKVDPNTAGLDNVRWTTWGARPVPVAINVGLTAALQCKGRGWDQLAQRLWDLSIQESSGHSHSPWYLPANEPPKTGARLDGLGTLPE